MKRVLVWRFDPVDQMPMQAIRLSVRTLSMAGYGEHGRLKRLAVQTWDSENPLQDADSDLPPDLLPPSGTDDESNDVKPAKDNKIRPYGSAISLDMYRRWSRLVPGTAVVEVIRPGTKAKAVEVDWDADPGEWAWSESSLKEIGFDQPGSSMTVPFDFFLAWEAAVLEVNPGLWGTPLTSDFMDPNPKKASGLIALR